VATVFASGADQRDPVHRPMDPWAFRSVLDKKPRMLTLALDTSLYAAYDLQACGLYKVWKGGVTMEGTAYTDKKNVQPTSWGVPYAPDSTASASWVVDQNGYPLDVVAAYEGYYFRDHGIHLKFSISLPSGEKIAVEEHPDFVRDSEGRPGFQRTFTTRGVPDGITLGLKTKKWVLALQSNAVTTHTLYFDEPPSQSPPEHEASYDHRGRYWMEKSECLTCHEFDRRKTGASVQEVSSRYPREKTAIEYLVKKIRDGGSGAWGAAAMNAHPDLAEREVREMVNYILALNPAEKATVNLVSGKKNPAPEPERKPGYGAPLAGVHPSYDMQTLHSSHFKPKVGGIAFAQDGKLLVTTWD